MLLLNHKHLHLTKNGLSKNHCMSIFMSEVSTINHRRVENNKYKVFKITSIILIFQIWSLAQYRIPHKIKINKFLNLLLNNYKKNHHNINLKIKAKFIVFSYLMKFLIIVIIIKI